MNYFDNFIAYILIRIIRDRNAEITVFIHLHGNIHRLKQTLLIYAGQDESSLIQRFRTLGRSADTNRGKQMPRTGEETAFLRQYTGIRNPF